MYNLFLESLKLEEMKEMKSEQDDLKRRSIELQEKNRMSDQRMPARRDAKERN
jgi:hypothetical protein